MQTKMQRYWRALSSPSDIRRFAGLLALLTYLPISLISCHQSTPVSQSTYYVLGTEVNIQIRGLGQADASSALAEAQHTLRQIHQQWHAWEPGMLEQLNLALAAGRCAEIDEGLRRVLHQARTAERLTQGHFNAAAGGIIRAWGFHTSNYPLTSAPPSADVLAPLLNARPSLSQVDLELACVSATNPAVRIDLGGIGKGAAVDLIVDQLKAANASHGLVNAGGDLRGFASGEQSWRIAIANPLAQQPLAILTLAEDEAVFTSGGYTRYGDYQGQRYAHILDPQSGQPARGAVSATVIADSGAVADAAATALVVAGPQGAAQIYRAMALKHLLLISADGCLTMDPNLAARLDYTQKAPACINVVPM